MACRCSRNTFKENLYARQLAKEQKAKLEEKKKKDAGNTDILATSKSK
jgi:hypothetical protein